MEQPTPKESTYRVPESKMVNMIDEACEEAAQEAGKRVYSEVSILVTKIMADHRAGASEEVVWKSAEEQIVGEEVGMRCQQSAQDVTFWLSSHTINSIARRRSRRKLKLMIQKRRKQTF